MINVSTVICIGKDNRLLFLVKYKTKMEFYFNN